MRRWLLVGTLALVACRRESVDSAGLVCFATPEGVPGTLEASVTQSGGASPTDASCVMADESGDLVLHTSFWYEPNPSPFTSSDMAFVATASCEAEIDEDPIVVTYAGADVAVLADGSEQCFLLRGGALVPTE